MTSPFNPDDYFSSGFDPNSYLKDSTPTTITTPAAKNNNPGNLRSGPNGFKKFNSAQEGYDALVADIAAKQAGKTSTGLNGDSTLGDFFKIYAPASDSNDPVHYAQVVSSRLGKDPATKLGSVDPHELAQRIAEFEDTPNWNSIKGSINSSGVTSQNPQTNQSQFNPENYFKPTPLATPGPIPTPNTGIPELTGALSGLSNIGNNIWNAGGKIISDIKADPWGSLLQGPQSVRTAIKSAVQSTADQSIGQSIKGIWDSFSQPIVNSVDLLENQLRGIPAYQKVEQAFFPGADVSSRLTDTERQQKASQIVPMLAALAAGSVAGKYVGAAAKSDEALSLVGAKDFSSISGALDQLPNAAKVDILGLARSGVGDVIKKGAAEGITGGLTASLLEAHADGQDALNSAFSYGIAGGMLGTVFEVGKLGSTVGIKPSALKSYDANETLNTAIKSSIARTMVQDFTGEAAIAGMKDLTKGVDIVSMYKNRMNPDASKVITGLPSVTNETLLDPTIGNYKTPNGDWNVLVQNSESPKFSSDQVSQFSKEGYITGEQVNWKGSNFIYEGKSTADNLKLRNPITGKMRYTSEDNVVRPEKMTIFTKDANGNWADPLSNPDPTTSSETEITDFNKDWKDLQSQLSQPDRDMMEANQLRFQINARENQTDAAYVLAANGNYTDNGFIKSISDPSVKVPYSSVSDIHDYVNSLMKTPDATDLIKNIQGKVVPDLAALQGAGNASLTVPPTGEVGLTRRTFDKANLSVVNGIFKLVPVSQLLASLDRTFPKSALSVSSHFSALEDATRQADAIRTPYIARARVFLQPLMDADATTRDLAYKYANTISHDEFLDTGLSGKAPTPLTLKYGEDLASSSTSDDRFIANRYASEKAWNDQRLATGKIDATDHAKAMDIVNKYINDGSPVTADQLNIVKTLDEIRKKPKDVVSLLEVLTHADAINNPDQFMSRSDFAKVNNISPDIINAVRQQDILYRGLAAEFGIENPLTRYVPVMTKYLGHSLLDADKMRVYQMGTDEQAMFAHSLSRTGYTDPDVIIKDMPLLFTRYMNDGLRNKYINPILAKMRNEVKDLADAKDPNAEVLSNLVSHIENQSRGYINPMDRLGEQASADHIGMITGDKANASSLPNLWTKYFAFKGLGFRTVVGMRHLNAVVENAAMLFGAGFTKDFVGNMVAGFKQGSELSESGLTPSNNIGQSVGGIEPTGVRGKISSGINSAIDASFKATLLPTVYKIMHATSYITATKRIGSALVDLSKKVITEDQFNKRLQLDLYTPADRSTFSSLINEKRDYQGATDFLARRTGEMLVGNFSKINNPMAYSSNFGKMAGQFGQWKSWQLQNLMNAVSSGDKISRAKRMGYILGTSAVAAGASAALGVNMYNWALYDTRSMFDFLDNPGLATGAAAIGSNMLPDESPLLQFLSAYSDARSPTSPSRKFSAQKLNSMMIPLPSGLSDAVEAATRAANGDPFPVWGFRLMGGQVNTQDYLKPGFNLFDF